MRKIRWQDVLFWIALFGAWFGLGWAFWTLVAEPTGMAWTGTVEDTLKFQYDGRDVEILAPVGLALALIVPIFWAIRRYTLNDLPLGQQWLSTLVRALVIAALAIGLSRVVFTTFESHVTTVFIVDTSASMPDETLTQAEAFIQETYDKLKEGDELRIVTFARDARVLQVPPGAKKVPAIARPSDEDDLLGSNIQEAMRLAYGLFPQDHIKRIVLITDGNQTGGDLLGETYNARDYGIKVFAKDFPYTPRPETLVKGFIMPEEVKVGVPFNLGVEIFSTKKAEASLTLWQNEYKDGTQSVELEPGLNTVEFKTEVYEPGIRRYKLNMRLKDAELVDTFAPNNNYSETLEVEGRPKVLYIEGQRARARYLEQALRKEQFDVEVASTLPRRLGNYENIDAVILSDVPAYKGMTHAKYKVLDQYVRRKGGVFIMAGGENSFGPGGYQKTYLEQMMPVSFDGEKNRDTPRMALMLVIDRSGSMKGQKLELAKEAAKATLDILQRNDKVGVIVFDDGYNKVVPMQPATNRIRILGAISKIRPGGGTSIAPSLQEAFIDLATQDAALKHIILLSDGEAPQENIFTEILPSMEAERITVSTVAVGRGADASLLKRIARSGGGRYYFTADPYSIPKIFTKETSTVSRNQFVEEPFRPRLVKPVRAMRGLDFSKGPMLLGYVSTKAKPRAEQILNSNHGEPILARWRRGLGSTIAFTSDVKNRWGYAWLRWDKYPKFWAQLIRDSMYTDTTTVFPMDLTIEQGKGRIVVDAVGKDDRYINHVLSRVTITPPEAIPVPEPDEDGEDTAEGDKKDGEDAKKDGDKKDGDKKGDAEGAEGDEKEAEGEGDAPADPLADVEEDKPIPGEVRITEKGKMEVILQQTAPGRYEATFDLTSYGSYMVTATHFNNEDTKLAVSRATLTWPYPDEYLTLTPNEKLITKSVEIGQGARNPSIERLYDPEGESVKKKEELWPYFLFGALALFILDLLLRRLRFYGKTAIPWDRVAGRG